MQILAEDPGQKGGPQASLIGKDYESATATRCEELAPR